jgi:fibronectin type 3 domain-containing protein
MLLPQGIRPPFVFCLAVAFSAAGVAFGNIPGGGTGTGANVTLVDNGSQVTIANGIISILCTKSGATIDQINYTYNNGSGTTTTQVLAGGFNGGQLYWELGGFGGGTFTYSLVSDPASNGGNYAEISLLSSSATNGTMEVHFSMLRGSTGFYVTAIWNHRSVDGVIGMGETRDNIYAGSIFNWMSVDAARNRLMAVANSFGGIPVFNAPKEVTLWTNGLYQGQYEDKYCYSADLGVQRAWGWSSVGAGGKNIGLWNVSASAEYYNGGPMKRELMSHIGTTILNMHNGSHYGLGSQDATWGAGELWTKVYGPYFIYCNNVSNTNTDPTQASGGLYEDALAQAAAEQTAWPYYWFTNANYAAASGRGAVSGTLSINDPFNANASPAGMWVGVVQQPSTTRGIYDFQQWMKPYQFWVKTDTNGNFTISNVIAGANYTLYAFGPGAAGTFQSQNQTGGNPPNTFDLPASPFSVSVTGGATNDLGVVPWIPTRVGPTVFEIGYPNRTGNKFRHGDDYWVGDLGPSPTAPSPLWSKHLAYPFDFPSGPNYIVGQSRWTTDWNYVQPAVANSAGAFSGSTSTITFNLPGTPGASASIYIALASDFQGPLIVSVNGTVVVSPSTGYFPNYNSSANESDTTIRQGIHGAFSDARINFSGSVLRTGQNTITINMRKGDQSRVGDGWENHAMYDYVRLELAGYVPPPPTVVAAYPGNNCALLSWPVTAGATSYNVLRSTTSGSGYVPITNGVIGPVCGRGPGNATFLDASAMNATTYYYVVESVNSVGASSNSPESAGATPLGNISASPPTVPVGVVATPGDRVVNLSWNPSAGANFYTIQRSTIVNNGVGAYVTLGTITLNNSTTGTSYTDTTPTDGSIYNYFLSATSAGGMSGNSVAAMARPLPTAPAGAVGLLSASPSAVTNVALSWSPVVGAIGYVIQRATSLNGTYNLLGSITETSYTDFGPQPTGATFYYKIVPVNAAGTGTSAITTTKPSAPATIAAIPGNTQVTVNWSASVGATGYNLMRGTSSGNETTTVVSGITSTTYTDAGLVNGTRYYYVVASIGTGATSGNSGEVSAVPSVPLPATFTQVTFANGNINMTGSGGVTNGLYYVLCRTNWTGQWVPLVTNQFGGNGNFSFSTPVNKGQPMMLFKLQSL